MYDLSSLGTHIIEGAQYCLTCNGYCTSVDDFSEDLLSAHESEVDRMRGFYQDNKEIFELLEKRDKLWQQQLELDVRNKVVFP